MGLGLEQQEPRHGQLPSADHDGRGRVERDAEYEQAHHGTTHARSRLPWLV